VHVVLLDQPSEVVADLVPRLSPDEQTARAAFVFSPERGRFIVRGRYD
jgi:hypothetical protein